MTPGYESFFGLAERPFSLTPDPRYFFKSRTHGRAIETLTFGLRRRERHLLVTGDLGLGKTILCRTLVEQLRRRVPVSLVANPLLTAGALFRLLLDDFGGSCTDEAERGSACEATAYKLHDTLLQCLAASFKSSGEGAVVVIDEAHTLPVLLVEHLLSLAALEHNREKLVHLVLVGQQAPGEPGALGLRGLDERVSTKARLLPLGRDECAAYVTHRLAIAGSSAETSFSPRALDILYGLSGGVPRLVNLLCERALQEAAIQEAHKIEPAMINAASSALELLRTRPRRFRWFTRRVS
jgi:general secretion pathway protein A